MDLILPEQATRLRTQFEDESVDQPPLVKLFCPWGAGTWLLSGLTEDDALGFGLCDLGMGSPNSAMCRSLNFAASKAPSASPSNGTSISGPSPP